jgi:hypothetical protein
MALFRKCTTTTKYFIPKVSWGKLEMKPHKNRYKIGAKKRRENQRAIKKSNQKGEKTIKC